MKLAQLAPRPKQVLIGLMAASLVAGVLAGVAYARTTIPSPSAIALAQTTTIYYSDGTTVLAHIGATNRTDVSLAQVPLPVQHAVLAAEDRHFYSEPGVSPTGILRALAVDIRGGDVTQGGSTITQQYAKNAYLSQQRSLTRKLKEILIATKLGQTRSKATILEDYLNTIYFGRGAYGIEAASKAYFNVPVGQLTTAQGALLAAIIRGPGYYDPRINPPTSKANAVARWHYVVNGMVTEGWLSTAQAAALRFPSTIPISTAASQCTGQACFIRQAVEQELINKDGLTQAQLDLGGYKIVTTIDKTAEHSLTKAEHTILPKNRHGTPESGAASVVPGDGAIRALYGGRGYCKYQKTNHNACLDLSGATGQWTRPPGSSFKAFTLLAALQKGISLSTTFDGPPTVDVGGFTIHNSSPGESCYGCSLTEAFAKSINTIFVPLAASVGPKKVVKDAYAAGISPSTYLDPVPDIALGPNAVSPLDLANSYATIAAGGIRATPYLVSSVSTTSGKTVYEATKHTTRVFSKDVTSDAIYAMTQVLAPGGTAYGHALSGRPSAGKTGTTGSNTNAWFTGFTPQLCTSVWIGNVDANKPLVVDGEGEVFGGTLPAEIWQSAMNGALAGHKVIDFPPKAGVGEPVTPTNSPTTTPPVSPTITPTTTPPVTPTITPTTPPVTPTITPTITPTVTPTDTGSGGTTPSTGTTGTASPAVKSSG